LCLDSRFAAGDPPAYPDTVVNCLFRLDRPSHPLQGYAASIEEHLGNSHGIASGDTLPRYQLNDHIQENPRLEWRGERLIRISLAAGMAVFLALILSCGANFGDVQPKDLCKCVPLEPDVADFRHFQKHVPIPGMTPTEATVDIILSWPQDAIVLPDAPRTGRELLVFHVAQAFLQNVSVNGEDCDVDLEISQTADRNAPELSWRRLLIASFAAREKLFNRN